VILNATYLIIMFPLQINVKCNGIENAEPILLNVKLLLFGDSRLSLEQTIIIVDAVHQYIKAT